MKQIGRGRTADIFEYDENKILKLYRAGIPKDLIQREFQASQFVCSAGIHSPQAYELVHKDDRVGIVFERVSGATLLSVMTKNIWFLNKYSRLLAALHYNTHTHVGETGMLRNQKIVLSDSVMSAPLLTQDEKSQIMRYLEQLPDGDKLCHGDYHPDNVLIGRANWIIDWMTGMSGNPAGDVARSLIILQYGTMPEGTPKLVKAIVQFLRNRIRLEYLKHYLMLSGQQYSDIERWILPVAAARLVEWIPKEEQHILLQVIKERLKMIS